ncbi:XopX family type III secretion system effector [Xanthomonas cissicola]|uniref:Type III secretion system effector protein n=1 Tax=Xanthomonas cissicola TaxID=86186 RepID=A0ABX3LZS3_9XANT|nr:type III secretion system effector protein [Xanthomonas cissicola]
MYIKQALQTATNSDNRTYEQTQKEMQQEKQQPTGSSATQESQGGQILAGLRPRSRSGTSSDCSAPTSPIEPSSPAPQASQSAPTTVLSTAATRNSALAAGVRRASAAVSQAVSDLWSLSDLRTMLQIHASDRAFLDLVSNTDPEQVTRHCLADFDQAMRQLRDLVTNAGGLEERFRNQVLDDVKAVQDALQPLQNMTPATRRALNVLISLANLWRVAVPSPLLANQAKTFAYTIGVASKGAVMLATSALRPTADGLPLPLFGGQLGRDANELHLYASVLNGMYLGPQVAKKFGGPSTRHQAEAVESNIGFSVAASTACAALVITPFVWSSVRAARNRLHNWAVQRGADLVQRIGLGAHAQQMRNGLTPGHISGVLRNELDRIASALVTGREEFQKIRREFTGPSQGHELTRTLNAQCTHLLERLDQCSKRLSDALGNDQDRHAAIPQQVPNHHDFSSKMSLALLGSGLSALGIYLVQPDKIGTADTVADTTIVTAVMMQSAFNNHATRQDTMERFKAMCGGSLVLALALGAEKLSKTFADKSLIEASSSSPYYAGLVMTLMCLTMPGPMARGAELAMNWGERQLGRMFTGPDGALLATTAPSSVEEMQERTRTTLTYLMSLTPEQLDQYEQIAGESTLQTIQEARDPAQAGPSSSVTITEITEANENAELAATSASLEQSAPARTHPSPDQAAASTAHSP